MAAKQKSRSVLILVLVEDGLGEYELTEDAKQIEGLNPCFSGGWSRSATEHSLSPNYGDVLILVLVEDGLGETYNINLALVNAVLILVLVEDGLGDPDLCFIWGKTPGS